MRADASVSRSRTLAMTVEDLPRPAALKCAYVGGSSNAPLGFVSLTENLMMVAMAVWMLVK